MSSFDVVNYNLRPSKSIQRQLVFQGVRHMQGRLDLENQLYVGLGSIWFTDFVLAHKLLGIRDMLSIEQDEIGYRRAVFNAPYATVTVRPGSTSAVLPTLVQEQTYRSRPWLVWLDYDYEFNESVKDDITLLTESVPINSIVLITFNGHERKYGNASDRPKRLRELFGDVVPDDLSKEACKNDEMQDTLANLAIEFMRAVAAGVARPGGFVPAFRLIYKDTAPMVTIGGVLPAKGARAIVTDLVDGPGWLCWPTDRIVAPHLTLKEVAVLQAQLPRADPLSRERIQQLGFDLDEFQIKSFEAYYIQYPAFAQIFP